MNENFEQSDPPTDPSPAVTEWHDVQETQTLAGVYGLDEAFPAQALASGGPMGAFILDLTSHEFSPGTWALTFLSYRAEAGWFGLTTFFPAGDRAELAACLAWVRQHSPIAAW